LFALARDPADTFDVFNLSGGPGVTVADLTRVLSAALGENGLVMSGSAVETVVERTFREFDANKDGVISFDEFRSMVERSPGFLNPLTLNIPEMINAAKASKATASSGTGGGDATASS